MRLPTCAWPQGRRRGDELCARRRNTRFKLGGIYDGHDVNPEVNKATKAAVAAMAGQGLVASAKDKFRTTAIRFPIWRASPR